MGLTQDSAILSIPFLGLHSGRRWITRCRNLQKFAPGSAPPTHTFNTSNQPHSLFFLCIMNSTRWVFYTTTVLPLSCLCPSPVHLCRRVGVVCPVCCLVE